MRLQSLSLFVLACVPVAPAQNTAIALGQGGPSGYVEVPASAALVPQGGITVEAWVHPTGFPGQYHAIVRNGTIATDTAYNLRLEAGGNLFWTVRPGPGALILVFTSANLPLNAWHHVAGTYDNGTARVFLDGVQVGAASGGPGPLALLGAPLRIGRGEISELWEGRIDSVRIWSGARTQAQIAADRDRQIQGAPGLVAAWNFESGLASSTGAHSGSAVGTVLFVPSTVPWVARLSAPALSSIGTMIPYDLELNAGALYLLDVSTAGTVPGLTGGGVHIPLNPPFLNALFGASLPGLFTGFIGTADGAGRAAAGVNVPPLPALAGTPLSATFVMLELFSPSGIGAVAPAVTTTIAGPPPQISAIQPVSGPASGGTPVVVNGVDFAANAAVRFGGVPATVLSVSPTRIACVTPPGSVGPANVTVTLPDGQSAVLAQGFTYVPTLVLNGIAPVSAAPGTTVTISGAGIQAGALLSVGGIPVAPLASSATALTFSNPPGVPCDSLAVVSNPDGQVASLPFNPSPFVAGVLNASGPAAGGTAFFVSGGGFHPGMAVTVGGAPAQLLSQSLTWLYCVSPPGTPGPAVIAVTTPGGCAATATFVYN